MPDIPYLATGGRIRRGGLAFVDPFHELVKMPTGAVVQPLEPAFRQDVGTHAGRDGLAPMLLEVDLTAELDGDVLVKKTVRRNVKATKSLRRART